jgi:hypothetical protein
MCRFLFAALAVVILLAPGTARADRIDGTWCFADGRNLTIKGPAMTTPSGHRIQGDYDRHAYRYTVPPNEPGAGQPANLQLLDEEHATYSLGKQPPAMLRRCSLHTS